MTAADKKAARRYGRRAGGWVEAQPEEQKVKGEYQAPPAGEKALRRHLLIEHRMPSMVLDEATAKELVVWHDAEHKHRVHTDLGHKFLRHRHDKPTALEQAESVEHAGRLRAARDGKLPASIVQEVVDRAAYTAKRRAEGLPVSRYDRECSEVAAEIAARAARKSKRRRAA